MKKKIAIYWFRQDLRLSDNPALTQAAGHESVLPIYILDDVNALDYAMGGASRWWLHHSLTSLNKSLDGHLHTYKGDPVDIFKALTSQYDVEAIYWNRCYEPWRQERDTELKSVLMDKGIEVKSYNGSLLWEPWDIKKSDGTPYKVFTPYYRKGCLNAKPPREPLDAPKNLKLLKGQANETNIDSLGLLPKIKWDEQLAPHWKIGEDGAKERLQEFLDGGIQDYKEGRNLPAKPYVSRLSPYLHFGEVSPNQLWYAAQALGDNKNIDHFCSELGWREFSHSLLYHNPDLPTQNLQSKFDHFPWATDNGELKAWQKGLTGIPMVDAGMRELWQTGYMHNRVRMIVGSFLVKNLRLHWHHGERWFWDTLVDADLANNSASWQWIAGCGADAAPYFRIFNPITQGQKFDPDGAYIRTYIPEIAHLPDKYIHCPWEAPPLILSGSNITLGKTYPRPIVDLKDSRERALEAFQSLKKDND
jgi:deoxyribodipyrimidine photo-lyase